MMQAVMITWANLMMPVASASQAARHGMQAGEQRVDASSLTMRQQMSATVECLIDVFAPVDSEVKNV